MRYWIWCMYLFVGKKSSFNRPFFRTSIGRLTELSEVIVRHRLETLPKWWAFGGFSKKTVDPFPSLYRRYSTHSMSTEITLSYNNYFLQNSFRREKE